jgi:hypothetical protein
MDPASTPYRGQPRQIRQLCHENTEKLKTLDLLHSSIHHAHYFQQPLKEI